MCDHTCFYSFELTSGDNQCCPGSYSGHMNAGATALHMRILIKQQSDEQITQGQRPQRQQKVLICLFQSMTSLRAYLYRDVMEIRPEMNPLLEQEYCENLPLIS